ncbi:hypothetical protein [Rhizobium leguminosarum]|uniref:hypothetical protein n=1 Tax=Rhizobium leguminosarum TaxID=384 RepID=UPI0009C84ACC|nr:hypothetical protein [Rhizobium leguminosarum]MBB5262783.1 hypothetical protein [Rhizobium leguminosarum]MBY5482737.1 hypothetical protein [Rhizobium leguminosarum]MDX5999993.1 hypothetical protein [Rhizobium leguminosarum]OOO52622.1 hypothetical protein BS629_08700 [Rhizobium leguminosarum bv. viciae USDA 2370]
MQRFLHSAVGKARNFLGTEFKNVTATCIIIINAKMGAQHFRFRRTETNLRGEFSSLHMEFFSQVDLGGPPPTRQDHPPNVMNWSTLHKHEKEAVHRPDVGIEAQFSNKKSPKTISLRFQPLTGTSMG